MRQLSWDLSASASLTHRDKVFILISDLSTLLMLIKVFSGVEKSLCLSRQWEDCNFIASGDILTFPDETHSIAAQLHFRSHPPCILIIAIFVTALVSC